MCACVCKPRGYAVAVGCGPDWASIGWLMYGEADFTIGSAAHNKARLDLI